MCSAMNLYTIVILESLESFKKERKVNGISDCTLMPICIWGGGTQ